MNKLLAALTALSLAVAASMGGSAPASAAGGRSATSAAVAGCSKPAIVSAKITPGTVVLGVSDFKGVEITVRVKTNGCAVKKVEVGLFGPNFVDTYGLAKLSSSKGVTTYDTGLRINPGSIATAEAGRWTSFVTVYATRNVEAVGPSFRLLRAARLTAHAAPTTVTKGRQLSVTGQLQRANWDTLRYRGYGGRTVALQRAVARGPFVTVRTLRSTANGSLRTSVTASRDACYRFAFAGSTTTAATRSGASCVDVR